MSIYFITEKNLFDNTLLSELSSYGELHFLSSNNNQNLNDLIANEKAKIIIYDPDYAGWEFPNTILNEVPNLKAIFLGTTDKSYVNLELCKEKNIEVFNIPKYATNSVAEYLVMYMFALAKKLPLQIKNENAQEFTDAFMQMEVSNKKIGIVGLGNIGTRIAEICSCIGGDICYWNRTPKKNDWNFISLEELFKECDVIFITLSINEETKKLITDDMLNSMKKTCIFISGSGKQLFNSNIVEEKVKNNELFGYALEEADTPLTKYEGNVLVTSEYGWFTKEASDLRIKKWYDLIIEYMKKQ